MHSWKFHFFRLLLYTLLLYLCHMNFISELPVGKGKPLLLVYE
jgi:hypothetical protein